MQGRDSRSGPGFTLARILFEVADQEFELLDVSVKLLGRLSEPCPPELGELHPQLLDMERLRMDFGRVGSDLDVLARQFRLQSFSKNPQRIWVCRERITRQGHATIVPDPATRVQPFQRGEGGFR